MDCQLQKGIGDNVPQLIFFIYLISYKLKSIFYCKKLIRGTDNCIKFFSSKKRNRHKKHNENHENKSEIIYESGEPQNGISVAPFSIQEIKQAMEYSFISKPPKTADDSIKKSYQFWNTQPVPKMGKLFKIVVYLVM